MGFSSLGLSAPLVSVITGQGYKQPTPIQSRAIPPILKGRDVVASAQTGTGKTAAFLLPLLQRISSVQRVGNNQVGCLILVPTRELANQVHENARVYGKLSDLRLAVVYGGVKINPQMMKLRKGVDILVATPGRLLDLYHSNAVRFEQVQALVLDEADKMLNLGFAEELEAILALLPKRRQNLLFSATFSQQIRNLASSLAPDALEISTDTENTAAKSVKQWLCPVDKKKKPALLTALIRRNHWRQVLVFTKTRKGADEVCRHLQNSGISAVAIHGDKSQSARSSALGDFKTGKVEILVATDIAARGLDIDGLPQVINFDMPKVAEDYIHRIGRTGRTGKSGEALSLVCADEFDLLNGIEQLIRKTIPREEIEGFEPKHNVPASKPIVGPRKPKKPKKPKVTRSGEVTSSNPGNQPQKNKSAKSASRPPVRNTRTGTGAKTTARRTTGKKRPSLGR